MREMNSEPYEAPSVEEIDTGGAPIETSGGLNSQIG